MHCFIVSCLFVTVLAAPQSYNYDPVRSANFNTNSQLTSTSKTQESQGFLQQTINSGNFPQLFSRGQITAHNTQDFSTVPNFSKFQPGKKESFSGVHQQQNIPLINNFDAPQQQQFNVFQQQQQQVPGLSTITKDIYVHIPPEDVQNPQFQHPAPPPPRKHYRIVFIKAPSHNIHNALRVQQAPTEEKTIIYVLTKKADSLDLQAALQEAQAKQPSKPEVYFIKYKTQEEAQHAQRTIQAQYEKLGGTSQISDEGIAPVTSVVGALDSAAQQQQQQQNPSTLNFSNVSGQHISSSVAPSISSPNLANNRAINNANKYLPPITKL